MSLIQKMKDKWKTRRLRRSVGVDPDSVRERDHSEQARPRIETQWGDVSEPARLQAALNMKADPAKRQAVEELLGRKLGSQEAGMAEARRRYPECYEDQVS